MPTDLPNPGLTARVGSITLARHGEPDLSRKVRISAREYRDWWARYEAVGIVAGQSPPPQLMEAAVKAGAVYTSTRPRSIETARVLVGAREMTHEALFIEAPLPPPNWPDAVKLSPRTWGVISRVSWWVGGHKDEESRPEAKARSIRAARLLHDVAFGGADVLLVAHGFFNTMIGAELRRLGWRCVGGRGYRYWSARRYERP
jgi:broad specificity phosphatase PhoE